MRLSRIIGIAVAAAILASCGGGTTAAPVTNTVTAAPVTVTAPPVVSTVTSQAVTTVTANSTVATTVMPSLTQDGSIDSPNDLTGDQTLCGVVLHGLEYVNAVEANYNLQDGSAPLDFLEKVADESTATFDKIQRVYLQQAGISDALREAVRQYYTGVDMFKAQGAAGVPVLNRSIADLQAACA